MDMDVCSPRTREILRAAIEAWPSVPLVDHEGTRDALTTLSTAFPAAKLTMKEADERLDLYADGLSDLPIDLASEACRRAVRECRFFPTVAELRAFVLPEHNHRRWKLSRMKAIASRHDREYRGQAASIVTPEERAAIRAEFGLDRAPEEVVPAAKVPRAAPRVPDASFYAKAGVAPLTEEEIAWATEYSGTRDEAADSERKAA